MCKKLNREDLKKHFVDIRGYWDETLNGLLELDPEFFEAYLGFTSIPWKDGSLEPKMKELCYIAVYACATHLYKPGIKLHIQKAMEFGAEVEEIIEVFQLVSALGIHTFLEGVPMVVEELQKTGQEFKYNDYTKKLNKDFNFMANGLSLLDNEYFGSYMKTLGIPWKNGPLTPKEKELIYIAGDASATHLYTQGWRYHIRNAFKYGATKEEILEVYQLVSEIGMDTFREGMPLLIEELDKVVDSKVNSTN